MSAPTSGKSAILDALRDRYRPILVFGPSLDADAMVRQRHCWVGPLPEAGIKDRDLIILEIPGHGEGLQENHPMSAAAGREIRDRLGIPADDFVVVLMGRDGSEKARWDQVVSAQEVFGKVDAMPMREQEVRERREDPL